MQAKLKNIELWKVHESYLNQYTAAHDRHHGNVTNVKCGDFFAAKNFFFKKDLQKFSEDIWYSETSLIGPPMGP